MTAPERNPALTGTRTPRDAAIAALAGLDAAERAAVADLLQEQESAQRDAAALTLIRQHIADGYPGEPALAVVFDVMEFDNGFFLTDNGDIHFTDGAVEGTDFPGLGEILTDEYGSRGASFALGVDLRDGTMHPEDYGHSVYTSLGLPHP